VQDNISVVFEASYKKSAVTDSEEYSFDVYIEYHLENGTTVGSQFHMGSLVTSYLDIPNYGRSDVSFKNATSVTSGPVIYGHKGIYPYLAWNFTYNDIPSPFSDSENSTLDFTVLNQLIITETEFKVKVGVLIDLTSFNYSYLEPYVEDSSTFDFVIANSFGVMLALTNATGVPIYPSRVENNTIYYEYGDLTLQTLNLNSTYYVEEFNGTVLQKEANVSYEIGEWTGFFDYRIENITLNQVARIYLDPEIRISGDFRVFNETSQPEQPPAEQEPTEQEENASILNLQNVFSILSENYITITGLALMIIITVIVVKKKLLKS